ncbi:ComEC/Rec2 family competence protein [Moraxella sp. E6BC]|uniref:ComEC/Rec2 family competence protein n=1 Tax=Moraxella sp. E6BC TaxID=3278712 RepID=UPI00359D1FE7
MPSFLSALIIAIMLGVLAVMPTVAVGDDLSTWLLSPYANGILSALLMCTVIGFGWLLRHAQSMKGVLFALLFVVLTSLFVFRAMMAHHEFEQSTISHNHTVTATVHIDDISDTVYDDLMGGNYRQKAVITDIKPVFQLNRHADDALMATNPFHVQADDQLYATPNSISPDDFGLPAQMTVLLTARVNPSGHLINLNQLAPNIKARMTLVLEPIATQKNASGFDGNIWLRTRHIHAMAQVIAIDGVEVIQPNSLMSHLESLRQQLRVHFYQDWQSLSLAKQQAKAVTLSLLTGDRALISTQTKSLYQLAGISHLLAISGTHVVFLALILASLVTWLVDKIAPSIYMRTPRWQIRLTVMLIASMGYALFTGFDVPAMRTVYMLAALALTRYFVLPLSDLSLLCIVGLIMAWLDPYVLWQAGFWLSFVAVLLLMRYENVWSDGTVQGCGYFAKIRAILLLQCWLFVAMLPLSILFFGKVSLWSVPVNLVVVGLFGVVIVPINLVAGAIFTFSSSIADVLWRLSSTILLWLHEALELLLVGDSWLYAPFGAAGFVLCVLVFIPLMTRVLPRSLLLLPASALCFMVINHVLGVPLNKDGRAAAILVNAGHDYLGAVLIKHESGAWLLLSDYGVKSLGERQADVLIGELRRNSINMLTGVITQTPSTKLPLLVARLQQSIPIGQYWQAGRSNETLSQLTAMPCQVGQAYQSQALSVRAITGWQYINDESVWGCTIEMVSDVPISLPDNEQDESTHVSRLVINGSTHKNTWVLWRGLCENDATLASPKAGAWLSHPMAVADIQAIDMLFDD